MRTAARPDGTVCSAQATPPLPPKRRSPPITVADRQWTRIGGGTPRSRAQAYRAEPAMAKRMPAMRKGGIVSIAIRIARYVDPQIR